MPSTERRQRRIDAKLPETSAAIGTPVTTSAGTAVSPEIPTPQSPTNLTVVGSFVAYAAVTPEAVVNLRWVAINSPTPDAYAIQWALDSGFTNPTTIITAREQVTAAVTGLPVNTTVHFRIAARWQWVQSAWSASVSTTTPQDTTPPAAPTALATSWNGRTGDLTITWTNPTSVNFRDVRLRISDSSSSTLYRTVFSSAGRYVYTLAQNRADSSSNGDTSIFLELDSRAFNGVFSTTTITATTSATAPATPTGMTVDFDEPDCAFNWTASPSVVGYRLSLDGVNRDLGFTDRYTYTLAQNAAEHGGSPDPVISWSLMAYDIFGVTSSAAAGTATSPAPSVPSNVALSAFFSTLTVSTTHTPLPTHRTYRYRITLGGNPFQQSELNSLFYTTSISSPGVYRAFVRTEDVFGRSSTTEADSGNVTADTLTIAELRAEGTYTDSQTVNNVLTDGTSTLIDDNSLTLVDGDDLNELKDNSTTSSGVTYSAGTAWQNFTRFERPLIERYRTITAGLFAPTTNTEMYVSTSLDGTTWRWFAGPLTNATSASATLSEVTSETAARATPVAIGSNATVTRWDLPRIIEARYVRLHHRNTTPASYVLYEFYPRRLVQSDDIEAESIRAINIAAEAITATKIAADAIDGKVITGATVQTSAGTGSRVVLDSGGLTTYNSIGAVQLQLPTSGTDSGRLIAGDIKLVSSGIQAMVPSGTAGSFAIFWSRNTTDPLLEGSIGYVQAAWGTAGTNELYVRAVQAYSSDTVFRVGLQSMNSSLVIRSQLDLNDNSIRLLTTGNERMTIAGSVVTFTDGMTIQGRGIQFDSTTSTNARTLDDYDEGTWTPTVVFSGGTGGFTYDHQVGRYTKIGRLVHVQGSIQFDETAASGNLSIGGLPYSASTTTNNNAGGTLYADGLTGVSGQIMYLLGGAVADKQMEVYFSGTGGRTRITNTHTGTNTMFAFSISYHV